MEEVVLLDQLTDLRPDVLTQLCGSRDEDHPSTGDRGCQGPRRTASTPPAPGRSDPGDPGCRPCACTATRQGQTSEEIAESESGSRGRSLHAAAAPGASTGNLPSGHSGAPLSQRLRLTRLPRVPPGLPAAVHPRWEGPRADGVVVTGPPSAVAVPAPWLQGAAKAGAAAHELAFHLSLDLGGFQCRVVEHVDEVEALAIEKR